MIIPWNDFFFLITHRWDITGDHLLFLVQKLLQSIQEKTKTLMTKVINPTRKKTQTNIKISYVIFIQNCYCSAGLLKATKIHKKKQKQTKLYSARRKLVIPTNVKGFKLTWINKPL